MKVSKKYQTGMLWEELLLATICEEFAEPTIAGVVLSVRKAFVLLCLWVNSDYGQDYRNRIANSIKDLFQLAPEDRVEFKPHKASIRCHCFLNSPQFKQRTINFWTLR